MIGFAAGRRLFAPEVIQSSMMDCGPASLKALEYALSLGQELQARLLLIHVFDWPVPRGFEVETEAYRVIAQEDTLAQLQDLVPDDARAWCQTEELIATGRGSEEIVRLART